MEMVCGSHASYFVIVPRAGNILFNGAHGRFRPIVGTMRGLALPLSPSLFSNVQVFYQKQLRLPACL